MNDFPEHLPVHMAVAPEKDPYGTTHTISPSETQTSSLAQHSLSPEKLGVTGYVRDVAGFVKDVVQEAQDRRQHRKQHRSSVNEEETRKEAQAIAIEASSPDGSLSPRSSPENRALSPLAEAATSLFPHVLDANTRGCSHAEELRMDMMMQHNRTEDFENEDDKLSHRILKGSTDQQS